MFLTVCAQKPESVVGLCLQNDLLTYAQVSSQLEVTHWGSHDIASNKKRSDYSVLQEIVRILLVAEAYNNVP